MKRIITIATLMITAASFTLGQTTDNQTKPAGAKVASTGVEQELTQLDREWTQALVRGDASILERVFADDYSATNALGKTVTKAEAIADLKSGANKLESNDPDNYSVRVFGDTAVMTHDGVRKGQRDGKPSPSATAACTSS